MPGSMLHLIIAKKVNPNAGIDFYIGNIAADAIKDRKLKDSVHFRNTTDMENALKDFALKAKSDYLQGILLHLYVDWKWDSTHMANFASKIEGRWHPQYSKELGIMTAYAYHNTIWAKDLWEEMESYEGSDFNEIEVITKENIKDMIYHQRRYQLENNNGPSTAFPPELIEKFASDTADEFIKWLSKLERC